MPEMELTLTYYNDNFTSLPNQIHELRRLWTWQISVLILLLLLCLEIGGQEEGKDVDVGNMEREHRSISEETEV